MSVSDYILASLYLVLWVITLIVYHRNRNRVDGGTLILGLQVLYAVFAILSMGVTPPDNLEYLPLHLGPYLYLWIMMLIAFVPVWYVHDKPRLPIDPPQTLALRLLSWSIIVLGVLSLPGLLHDIGGIFRLFSDSGAGQEAYNEALDNSQDSGHAVTNIVGVLFNACSDVAIFLFFYYLTQIKDCKGLLLGLALVMSVILLTPVTQGQRGNTITSLLTIGGAFFMWLPYMSEKIVWWTKRLGILLSILILLPIGAITISRYGEADMGSGGSIAWYMGQGSIYFNNYALDDDGIRYGDRTFNLVKRVIDPSTPANFMERRLKYANLKQDDNIFTTFVGDFCIDFGPYVAVLLFVVFNAWVVWRLMRHGKTWKLHHLLLLYFVICIQIQGGMTLFSYSDTGGLKIIVFLALYIYLQTHEHIIAKYGR